MTLKASQVVVSGSETSRAVSASVIIFLQEGTRCLFPCGRWLSTSEDDGQICRELVSVDKSEFERRKSRRMSRSGSKASLSQGDAVDLEQKGKHAIFFETCSL